MPNHVRKLFFFFYHHQCQIFVGFKPSLNPSCCGLNIQLVWFIGKMESYKSVSRLEGYFWAPLQISLLQIQSQ